MEPQDVIWRILERLTDVQTLLSESPSELHPKKNADLISSIQECEQLTRTQINIMNRISKKY